jgi:hypothetical protein
MNILIQRRKKIKKDKENRLNPRKKDDNYLFKFKANLQSLFKK